MVSCQKKKEMMNCMIGVLELMKMSLISRGTCVYRERYGVTYMIPASFY